MKLKESIQIIEPSALLESCQREKAAGRRLCHMTCCKIGTENLGEGELSKHPGEIEISYGLDKDFDMVVFRIYVKTETAIPSMTPLFPGAYLYENEINELYGMNIEGIVPDFRGNFYQVGEKRHFNPAIVASESGMARVLPRIPPIVPKDQDKTPGAGKAE
jgi:ech hydrogenase subunit D